MRVLAWSTDGVSLATVRSRGLCPKSSKRWMAYCDRCHETKCTAQSSNTTDETVPDPGSVLFARDVRSNIRSTIAVVSPSPIVHQKGWCLVLRRSFGHPSCRPPTCFNQSTATSASARFCRRGARGFRTATNLGGSYRTKSLIRCTAAVS